MIEFFVESTPQPQPRARSRKGGGGVYNPSGPVDTFKMMVRLKAGQVFAGRRPIVGPVACSLVFLMPRTQGQMWKRKPMPRIPHAKKPDRDNAVLDALKGIAWVDDAQVCDGRITKWTAAGNEPAGVEIYIQSIGERSGN